MKKLISIGVFSAFVLGCSQDNESVNQKVHTKQTDTTQAISTETSRLPSEISKDAYSNYTYDQYPRIFDTWGKDWVQKISEVEHAAARKIANDNNDCDVVDYVGLSENKSVVKQKIVVFVDCRNGERYFVSDSDIKDTQKISSQSEKAISLNTAFKQCQVLVKNSAKYPSSLNFSILNTQGFQAQTTGNVVVTMQFDAQNDLKQMVTQKAKCIFTPDGESEITFIS